MNVLALSEPGMGRRRFLARSAASLAAAGLALGGCVASGGPSLNIYNWSSYIGPTTVSDFERETGIAVNYDVFSNQDVLFAKLKIGLTGYDLIVATDYMLRRLLKHGLLSPLPGIEGRDRIDARFRTPPWDPELAWSLPYLWGTTGIGYNQARVRRPAHSWDLLWDPAYAQRITMLEEKRDTIGAALIRLGHSGNSKNMGELEQAMASLREQKPLLRRYTSDYIDDLARNEIWLSLAWSGDVAQARNTNPDINYFLPEEGGFMFVDSWCIPRAAPHPTEAAAFLDYITRPEVAAAVTNHIGYPNTLEGARRLARPDLLDNPLSYPPEEMLARTCFQEDLGPAERTWDTLWSQLKFGGSGA